MTDTDNQPANNSPKWFLQSKTILGAIVMVIPAIASLLGITVPLDEVSSLSSALSKLLEVSIEVAGFALVLYGRFKAKRPLKVDPDSL